MLCRIAGLVCLLVGCAVSSNSVATGADPPTEVSQTPEWQSRIEAALNAKGEWDFFEAPLREVCRELQAKLGIDVALDTRALEDYGIDPDTPITRKLSGISNRSFLRLVLHELELAYTMRLGALWITNYEEAEAGLTTRVYPVGDLLLRDVSNGGNITDYDQFIDVITSVVAPDTWDKVGGPGAIEGIYDSLVVSQTQDVHEQIAELFVASRTIVASDPKADKTCYMLGQSKMSEAILVALEKPFTAEIKNKSLKELVEILLDKTDIPIVIDTRALEDYGLDTSSEISGTFQNTPLRFVLARLLADLELTYIVDDEVLQITTPDGCGLVMMYGLYPVHDLVSRTDLMTAASDRVGNFDFDSLMETIKSTIEPDTWDEVGGPGAIEALPQMRTLVVSQDQYVHQDIKELLTNLRKAKELTVANQPEFDPRTLFTRAYPLQLVDCTSDEVAKLIMRSTSADFWRENEVAFVQGLGSSLVVKHNATMHYGVQKLLNDLGLGPAGQHGCFACPPGTGGAGNSSTGSGTVGGTSGGGAMPASNGPSPGGFF